MYFWKWNFWVIFLSQEENNYIKLDKILSELSIIKASLMVSNYDIIEQNLDKIITTDDRKLMWIHLDGKKTQDEIAKLVGKTQAAVSYFISWGKNFGLIDDNNSQARRTIDIIPKSWHELKKKKG